MPLNTPSFSNVPELREPGDARKHVPERPIPGRVTPPTPSVHRHDRLRPHNLWTDRLPRAEEVAAAIKPQPSEPQTESPPDTDLVDEKGQLSILDRFRDDLQGQAFKSAFWSGVQALGAMHGPLGTLVTKTFEIAFQLALAARSLNAGNGLDINISAVHVSGLSLGVRIKLCEADPPSTPDIGLHVGSTASPALFNLVSVDGAAKSAVLEDRPAARGLDITDLVALEAARVEASKTLGNESWQPWVVAYLKRWKQTGSSYSRNGRIIIGQPDGGAYHPFEFELIYNTADNRASDQERRPHGLPLDPTGI